MSAGTLPVILKINPELRRVERKEENKMKIMIGLLGWLLLFLTAAGSPLAAAEAPAVVVGRVYHLEGDLLRYVPAEDDWVAVVKDAPFGAEDTLYTGSRGRAELILPNGTWIRLGNNTQIQFIALDAEVSEVDLAAGMARFYNKGLSRTVIKATSPYGYVLANSGTAFDFYVGEKSIEVVPVKGRVSFVHSATNAKYDLSAGSTSILADGKQVASGEGTVDPDWERWNAAREEWWSARTRTRGRSIEYLPPSLWTEAYDLDANGSWYRVYYEGAERWFWRPTTVYVGWTPFIRGRWTDWYGDQCWIPSEPFGYVTHHYGNWVYVGNYWYWAPPIVSVRVGLPLLDVGYYWYPGRVSWIYSELYIGWIPLAPHETYYCHRQWGGRHTVVVTNINIARINIHVGNYAFARQAIVVPQDRFYSVNSYRNVRMANIKSTTIINNYQGAPVVDTRVIKNYTQNGQRYNFANVAVKEKPHRAVVERIRVNEKVIRQDRKINAATIEQQVRRLPEGKVYRESRIEPPKVTNYIVPADKVNRPKSEIKLERMEIRPRGEGAPSSLAPRLEPRPVQPERTGPPQYEGPSTSRVLPRAPAPVRPEPVRPERVAPASQAPKEIPRKPAERIIAPPRQEQKEKYQREPGKNEPR